MNKKEIIFYIICVIFILCFIVFIIYYFGIKCKNECGDFGECNKLTKKCLCNSGYTGDFCNINPTKGWSCTDSTINKCTLDGGPFASEDLCKSSCKKPKTWSCTDPIFNKCTLDGGPFASEDLCKSSCKKLPKTCKDQGRICGPNPDNLNSKINECGAICSSNIPCNFKTGQYTDKQCEGNQACYITGKCANFPSWGKLATPKKNPTHIDTVNWCSDQSWYCPKDYYMTYCTGGKTPDSSWCFKDSPTIQQLIDIQTKVGSDQICTFQPDKMYPAC
jgi:hypothetical protein